MIKIFLAKFLFYLWSSLVHLLYTFLKCVTFPRTKTRSLLETRKLDFAHLKVLEQQRTKFQRAALFFCSSAGEYEQIVPLIHRLEKTTFCVVCFFSRSGINYVKKIKENTPYFLSPVDVISSWQFIFEALTPSHIFVVRHELWPSFLYVAKKYGTLYLLNGCKNENHQGILSIFVKRLLLRMFDRLCVLSLADKEFFKNKLKVQEKSILVTGDTKYDRVFERVEINKQKSLEFVRFMNGIYGALPRLIVGSAWEKDATLCLDALVLRKKQNKIPAQLVIVPHEPTIKHIEEIVALCVARTVTWHLFSNLKENPHKRDVVDVIVVDALGVLAELYACGEWAFVGGALHYQVHNVLEPSVRGLATSFGPFYKNSPEAKNLIEHHVAHSFTTAHELAAWWNTPEEANIQGSKLKNHIAQYCQATQKIMDLLI